MTMGLSQRFEPIDRIHRGTGLIWTLCEPKGEGRDLGPTPSVAPLALPYTQLLPCALLGLKQPQQYS